MGLRRANWVGARQLTCDSAHVTQARGNAGYGSNRVSGFKVQYAVSAKPKALATVPGT